MAEYHLLRCSVALAGDREQIVVRGRHDPILFPELIVLQFIHGEDAITDVHVVGTCEMAIDEAWQRMTTIYGETPVKAVFPGARPTVPRKDDTVPLCTQPIYVPEPTRPDSPEPRLRPLDRIAVPMRGTPRRTAPAQPIESEPTPDEIAAHAQDDDEAAPISDQELSDMGLGAGSPLTSGRVNYPGQTSQHANQVTVDVASSADRYKRKPARV